MPLLDIATAQPSFHCHVYSVRAQTSNRGKVLLGYDRTLASTWKSFHIPTKTKRCSFGHIETRESKLIIRAVATLERECSLQSKKEYASHGNIELVNDPESSVGVPQSSREDAVDSEEELDDREKLRRLRISKANKGNTPWNKGRKHSAETLQRIRERTRLAMQDPKVKMKLVNLGHAQSKETRMKIGVGVRMGWDRRREKLMLQETCHFEWLNLIAEASRVGLRGEEELQWDSYEILDNELEQEWLESVERRKNMPRPKGSKRAPKSADQRKKISEAISAKWADPGYRGRVVSALAKYHGTTETVERRPRPTPRPKPSVDRPPRKRNPVKKKVFDTDNSAGSDKKTQSPRSRVKKSNMPMYKDPLASSKLEMIKSIRAQRASSETKKTEAIERAKLLIAEAEKAAKALEIAAVKSPIARASLIETRKLIAEAIQSIESIGTGLIDSAENVSDSSSHVEDKKPAGIQRANQTNGRKINGSQALELSKSETTDFNFRTLSYRNLLNGTDQRPATDSSVHNSLNGMPQADSDSMLKQSTFTPRLGKIRPNGKNRREKVPVPNGSKVQLEEERIAKSTTTGNKKWVRGRLVEMAEGN